MSLQTLSAYFFIGLGFIFLLLAIRASFTHLKNGFTTERTLKTQTLLSLAMGVCFDLALFILKPEAWLTSVVLLGFFVLVCGFYYFA